jgi:hypothetical protein
MLLGNILVSCKGASSQAMILFFTGTATIQHVNEQPKPVSVQETVKNGDIIETKDKSSVIVQAGNEFTMRFEENTRVVISSIADLSKKEISLNKGKVLSRISKLEKGREYMVKTPTAVASVRGTEFLTDFSDGKTVVAVGKGKVSVVKIDTKEEKFADPGKAVVVAEKVEIRDLNQVETLELKKLESTPSINDAGSLKPEQLKEKMNPVIDKEKEINDEIEKLMGSKGMSFEEMKVKFHRVDVITLYNGRVIRGVILSRGQFLKIVTPSGVITVNAKDIQRTGVM